VDSIAKYKVGIAGCGLIAGGFEEDPLREHPCTHIGAFKTLQKTEVVAAAEINAEKLQRFSKRWGVKNTYTDYRKMVSKEDIDILSVCTNTPSHADVVIAAAEAGVKCIFCEKPIAVNLKEADEMIKICRKNGVILAVNHTRRWDSNYQNVKEMLLSGRIGEIKFATGYCNFRLLNSGTHLFDTLRYFFGNAEWVFGRIMNDDVDPGGYGVIGFKNKTHAFVDLTNNDYDIFEIDINGSAGRIKISGNGRIFELWSAKQSKNYADLKELYPEEFPRPAVVKNMMVAAAENMVDCIEKDEKPICSGEDGRAALEIVLAFHESHKKNMPIKLPLKNETLTVKTAK